MLDVYDKLLALVGLEYSDDIRMSVEDYFTKVSKNLYFIKNLEFNRYDTASYVFSLPYDSSIVSIRLLFEYKDDYFKVIPSFVGYDYLLNGITSLVNSKKFGLELESYDTKL